MGFFHRLAGDRVVACEPGAAVNPAAVAAIAERGVGISKEIPQAWTDETVRAADVVIFPASAAVIRGPIDVTDQR
ncbi:MAG TPA: hypothetical protein VEV65_00990, partial [Kineosporiaceae bacterium]|nr:hypothetical protein [Kineosporiaceae bacterium]